MKRKLFVLTVIILLCSLTFSACGKQTVDEYFDEIGADADKSFELLTDAKERLSGAESYTYTVSLYSEKIANYDGQHLTMPAEIYTCESEECGFVSYGKEYEKCPDCGSKVSNQSKKWLKPDIEYTYTKVGADFYVKVSYTDHVYDEDGMPAYSEKTLLKKSQLLYEDTVSAELWCTGGSITFRDNDANATSTSVAMKYLTDIMTAEGSDVNSYNLLAAYLDDGLAFDKNAVFGTETSNLLGKHVTMLQTYTVVTGDGIAASYRTSKGVKMEDELKSDGGKYNSTSPDSYGENLAFNWGDGDNAVSAVIIDTVSATVKKKRLTSFEIYSETIGAYKNVTTQIWDENEVTKWNGARVSATKYVFNVDYGTKKHPITLPTM